ncbi:hypothetical protein [Desulfamplus magnetovallimortis]|uniref:hypothetical protein n=1 Tax=Desulfamplus magnetovallimortis TaxID=1246637 RepID=UPI001119B438|nr:hypothetical protein [Desulfamplus magnetovallimortis]
MLVIFSITILMLYPFYGIGLAEKNQSHEDSQQLLLKKIESLALTWRGYTLSSKLTEEQYIKAQNNLLDPTTKGTFRFRDGSLVVVADNDTRRILVIIEIIEDAGRKNVMEVVGNLFMQFGEPTIMAHGKIIYWVYGDNGVYSRDFFEKAKKERIGLNSVATVKLQSDIEIVLENSGTNMENNAIDMKKSDKNINDVGKLYIIISSEKMLKVFFHKSE